MTDLIYDIGMDDGDDSDFYLRNGFRVVAVEADPELCEVAAKRFRLAIADGRLTIVNRAIAPKSGPVTFHRSTTPGWGTVVEDWHRDIAARGGAADALVVDGITLADLVAAHGAPFYMKLDIEGMDRIAVEGLAATAARPRYLSMETSFAKSMNLAAMQLDFETLTRLDYDRFKIVDQQQLAHRADSSAAGPSGPFGEETPGEWLSANAALESFRALCRTMRLPLLLYRNRRLFLYYSSVMRRLHRRSPNLSWYDIHAKHASVD